MHHLIFNQIQSKLSCHAGREVNGGSYAFLSANEKPQYTHGMADTACPFPIRSQPAMTRTTNGSAPLHMVVSSKFNHFISELAKDLTVCLSY